MFLLRPEIELPYELILPPSEAATRNSLQTAQTTCTTRRQKQVKAGSFFKTHTLPRKKLKLRYSTSLEKKNKTGKAKKQRMRRSVVANGRASGVPQC